MSFGVSAAKQASRAVRNAATMNETRTHIQLRDLPLACLQSDIRRMLSGRNVQNVRDVAIDYHMFKPTGRAYLTFQNSADMKAALQLLQGAHLTNVSVSAVPAGAPAGGIPPQRRVNEPAAPSEAARIGNGPRAGIAGEGRSVLIEGVPGFISVETMRARLAAFRLAGGHDIYTTRKRGIRTRDQSVLVQFATEADAHQLVREWHLTTQFPSRENSASITYARLVN